MFWNGLDLLCICGLVLTLLRFPFDHQPFSPASLLFNQHTDKGMGWQPVYTQFDKLEALELTRFWFAITSLMWWIRGIEYFGVFPVLQLPVIAIWYSMSTVMSFLAFFGVLLVGASMCFRFLFGSSSHAFADLTSSTMSMLLASIGEFRTEEIMVDYRHSDAEFWMLMWAIVMSFIVLTMFVAIIDQGYQDAKESLEVHPVTGTNIHVLTPHISVFSLFLCFFFFILYKDILHSISLFFLCFFSSISLFFVSLFLCFFFFTLYTLRVLYRFLLFHRYTRHGQVYQWEGFWFGECWRWHNNN